MEKRQVVICVAVLAVIAIGCILFIQQQGNAGPAMREAVPTACLDCGPAGWQATGKSCANLIEIDDKLTAATCLNLEFGLTLKDYDVSEGYVDIGEYKINAAAKNSSSIRVYGNDRWAITATARYYLANVLG